jgi:hypothetical protein
LRRILIFIAATILRASTGTQGDIEVQLILVGPAPAVTIATGMTSDKAAFFQRRHVSEQCSAAHFAFVRQSLSAWVALAGFFVVKIRQLDQDNLGGGL